MRRILVLLVLATFGIAACGGGGDKEEGNASKACGPMPAAVANSGLPSSFPSPSGVTITATRTAGPTVVASGFAAANLTTTYSSYRSALARAPYHVTKNEKDAHDAEVNFAGDGNSGQVKLGEACRDRTSVQVTVRPG